MLTEIEKESARLMVRLALEEDVGSGDITANATIDATARGEAVMLARESFVVCGNEIAAMALMGVDEGIAYEILVPDGREVSNGDVLAVVSGPMRGLLTGERTALNFLQRLSGIATASRAIAHKLEPYGVGVYDTRKTTPGLRLLEKYAVRTGGGRNHRIGLWDAFLIKNNHIDALGGDVGVAIRRCREAKKDTFLQVEVRNRAELEAAIAEAPDCIMLDNMSPKEIISSVALVRERQTRPISLEASGGITASNIEEFARTGIDRISVGAITHSSRAVDISFRYQVSADG